MSKGNNANVDVSATESNGKLLPGNSKMAMLNVINDDQVRGYTFTHTGQNTDYIKIHTRNASLLRIYRIEYTLPEQSQRCSGIELIPTNTTGSDNADFLNTDSDGDGCYDANEAGFTDDNKDGIVDGSGYETNGSVSGSNGYTGTKPAVTDDSMVDTCLDTDGDGISNNVDLDDDNDGILDTVESNCIFNKAAGTVTGSGSGYTLLGPTANQTTPNELYNGNGHGWMSLNEKIAPGGRLILNAAFFEELYENMGDQTYVHIGIRNNPWYEHVNNPSNYGGFKNKTYIKIWKYRNHLRFTLQATTGNTTKKHNKAGTYGEQVFMSNSPEAFIELSNDGMQVRLGLTYNGLHDVTTTTYDDWDADRKVEGTVNNNNSNILFKLIIAIHIII